MSKCLVKRVNTKWYCYGPDGKNYCAYDRKDWAVQCGRSHGWEVQYDNRSHY